MRALGRTADGSAVRVAPVVGDARLLARALRNLVDNALLYTPAGGLVTVRVVEDPFGQVVVLQVEDTGPGIPADYLPRLFEAFSQADAGMSRRRDAGRAVLEHQAVGRCHPHALRDGQEDRRIGLAWQAFVAAHRFYEKHGFDAWPKAGLPKAFPVMAHDDMLDCLARIEDPEFKQILRWPMSRETPPPRGLLGISTTRSGRAHV